MRLEDKLEDRLIDSQRSKEKIFQALTLLGTSSLVLGGFLWLSPPSKSALTVLRDKPYFTGESTSTYSPVTQPPLVLPSNLSIPVMNDVRVPAMDDRYVVAPRRLENGKTGVSITPLGISHNDSYWFELLDLDGDHTTVEKKIVRQAFYHQMQIPVVTASDVYFTPVRMDIAPIPTAEDHDLMQRLTKRTNIQ